MKSLALVLLLALTSALAQEHPVDVVAGALANHLDATISTCPDIGVPASCYAYVADVEIHKTALDVFVMGASEFSWVVPWFAGEDGRLSRAFMIGETVYLIALMPSGGRGSGAMVLLADDL